MCIMWVPGAHGGQKAVLESLKLDRCEPSKWVLGLELQVVEDHQVGAGN